MCLYLYSLIAYPVTTVKQDITVQAITSKHISTITALLFLFPFIFAFDKNKAYLNFIFNLYYD